MSLGPKEMTEKVIGNLQQKTGKTLQEWVEIVHKSGLDNPREQISLLKSVYHLGHVQATIVAKHSSSKAAGDYIDETALIDRQFLGKNAHLRDIFDALQAAMHKMGLEYRLKPCKTYLPFYHKTQFLVLKAKNGILWLGLPVPSEAPKSELYKPTGLGMPEKMSLIIPLSSVVEITAMVLKDIEKAYWLSRQEEI
jgi:predicted transport protein